MTAVIVDPAGNRTWQFSEDHRDALRRRGLELLRREIDFIPHAEFHAVEDAVEDAAEDAADQLVDETLRRAGEAPQAPTGLPAHLGRMCRSELLTHEQETALFREMNCLKYQAHALRARLDPEQIDPQVVVAIESRLARAQKIRDHIIQANVRLVMSIVKKFVTPRQSFDDLLSDGMFTLMQVVDKFDHGRGFRFSTYAYRSIARTVFRSLNTARTEEARVVRNADEWAFQQVDDRRWSSMSDQAWSDLRQLTASLVARLDRREKFVIRSRYALGAHRKVRTYQELADKLGVSKERTRQLEHRAVQKLQAMASQVDSDQLLLT